MTKKSITQKLDKIKKDIKDIDRKKLISEIKIQNIIDFVQGTRKDVFRLEVSFLTMLKIIVKNKLTTTTKFEKMVNKEVEKIIKRQEKEYNDKKTKESSNLVLKTDTVQ